MYVLNLINEKYIILNYSEKNSETPSSNFNYLVQAFSVSLKF